MLIETPSASWLSYYIYHKPGDSNVLLMETLDPAIQHMLAMQSIQHFFFIRYKDSYGIHIRLRLQADSDGQRTAALSYLNEVISSRYHRKIVPYERELARYGGLHGLLIAEALFEASSRAVLGALRGGQQDQRYERALGVALQLHIALLRSSGMGVQAAYDLCAHIAGEAPAKTSPNNRMPQDQLATLWKQLEHNTAFSEEWFMSWIADTQELARRLAAAHHNGKLQKPHRIHAGLNETQALYESYIHMTNNRMGIANTDEPRLAGLITTALESL